MRASEALSNAQKAVLVRDAARSGVPAGEIGAFTDGLEAATTAHLADIREVLRDARAKHVREYYVVGPGVVVHESVRYEAGAIVRLTAPEAAELGGVVAEGRAPAPLEPAHKRRAGRYRVNSGSVTAGGRCYGPGLRSDIVELSAADAQSLAHADISHVPRG